MTSWSDFESEALGQMHNRKPRERKRAALNFAPIVALLSGGRKRRPVVTKMNGSRGERLFTLGTAHKS